MGVLLAVMVACAAPGEARFEVWENGAYVPRAVSAYTISGERDGAATRAVATFTLESGARLRLDLEVVYNPKPELGEARWTLEHSGDATGPDGETGARTGEVRAEALRFLGGQGAGPSLGGRFRLDEKGARRYRVVLPLQPVEQPQWDGQ